MTQSLIAEQSEFDELCAHVRETGLVAFDTEFVSEFSYRPELCLLQFATKSRSIAADPYRLDLENWWEIMADPEVTVVVHGGQAEIRFCLQLGNRAPQNLVDVQLAEGLRSRSYPLGYSALVSRVLGKRVHNKETRTDWRRRPLSADQIEYALDDVRHVLPIWAKQKDSLTRLERMSWAAAEFDRQIAEIAAEVNRDSWRRLSGIHKLNARELAGAIELSDWREREAGRRDRPLRRLLRDDLIIELARRQPRSVDDLLATRDMNRTEYRRVAPELIEHIERALALPESELPDISIVQSHEKGQDEHVLGQLLGIALANRCAEMNVAKQIVGTSADLRQLVRWHLYSQRTGTPPRLATGWRADVCGDLLTDVLDGKVTLRVADPDSDHPLAFERLERPE